MGGYLRDDLVSEAGEEEDRDFGYGWEETVGSPDLVAKEGEISSGWDYPAFVSPPSNPKKG